MRRLSGSGACLDVAADDEAESVTRTSKDQRDEELQVFWSYISNMLINFESLPLERIYTMLKMFAMPTSDSSSTATHSGSGECDIEVRLMLLDIPLTEFLYYFLFYRRSVPFSIGRFAPTSSCLAVDNIGYQSDVYIYGNVYYQTKPYSGACLHPLDIKRKRCRCHSIFNSSEIQFLIHLMPRSLSMF